MRKRELVKYLEGEIERTHERERDVNMEGSYLGDHRITEIRAERDTLEEVLEWVRENS